MKKTLMFSSLAAAAIFMSCGKQVVNNAAVIEDIPTVQKFIQEEIPESDVQKILKAGINAQSAMNVQPWHFTVITNKEVLSEIGEKLKANMPKRMPGKDLPPAFGVKAGMGDSPLAILVSAKDGAEFDAGLSAEMMTAEAAVLGYGTKIISSPVIVLNGPEKEAYKKLLGIPQDMSAKAVILIGKYDQAQSDAVTSASPRKAAAEVVNYIK